MSKEKKKQKPKEIVTTFHVKGPDPQDSSVYHVIITPDVSEPPKE